MPKNKKINPRKVPASKADVEAARVEGCEIMANIVLFLLSNDFAFSHEDIHRVHDRIELYLSQIINFKRRCCFLTRTKKGKNGAD